MNVKKLKAIAILIIFILVLIVIFTRLSAVSHSNPFFSGSSSKKINEMPTNTTADLSNFIIRETRRKLSSYIEPDEEDISIAYNEYGYENCYFTSQGLMVNADEYEETEDRLYTNIWPSYGVMIKIPQPDFGEIDLVEAGLTYSIIYMQNIEKKDADSYAKKVKEMFEKNIKSDDKTVLYQGLDKGGNSILVSYDKESKELMIYYKKR